uniref:Small ribosomal subunit protein uS11c n=1 Tax=Lagarostrobos franklinii TaxID=56892 RepID=A0A3T0ZD99_LAGFR|nr:ribosomal protein S11 [Lagarostrobos franklinii]BBF90850.1 ribosomal protein S11 [Lagarostrobos franklinii]
MPKITRRRIGSRRNKRRIVKGVIYIRASFHNTIVTVTDVRGQVVSWSSAGACGFKGKKKGTAFAGQTAVANVIGTLRGRGMKRADVKISGPGSGRDTVLRTIRKSGILLNYVHDVTPMPHNGCRPPKKRRL